MGWFAELGGALLYGLAWILVMILAFIGVILLANANFIGGIVALLLIAAMWAGRKYYRKWRPARQTIIG